MHHVIEYWNNNNNSIFIKYYILIILSLFYNIIFYHNRNKKVRIAVSIIAALAIVLIVGITWFPRSKDKANN